MILNLHGLYGTAKNANYGILKKLYSDSEIYSPQIEFENRSPYKIIKELYTIKDIRFIVGNSFGGFYAYILSSELNCPCLLTNPCIPPDKYIKQLIPEYPDKYLNELRQLTEKTYIKEMHSTTCNTFVILGKDDDVLDSNFTKNYLKNSEMYEIDGGHRISGKEFRYLFKEIISKMENNCIEFEHEKCI